MSAVKGVEHAFEVAKVQLTEDGIKYLEEPYKPRALLP